MRRWLLQVGGPLVYVTRCYRCSRLYLRRPFHWHRCVEDQDRPMFDLPELDPDLRGRYGRS